MAQHQQRRKKENNHINYHIMRIILVVVIIFMLSACSKKSPSIYYFNFHYENNDYLFDSVEASYERDGSIRIVGNHIKSPSVFMGIGQRGIAFNLLTGSVIKTGMYIDTISDREVTATYLNLVYGNAQNPGYVGEAIHLDSLIRVSVNIDKITDRTMHGTFSIIPSDNNPTLTLTNGEFMAAITP